MMRCRIRKVLGAKPSVVVKSAVECNRPRDTPQLAFIAEINPFGGYYTANSGVKALTGPANKSNAAVVFKIIIICFPSGIII